MILLTITVAAIGLLTLIHFILGGQYKRTDLDYSDETSIFNDDDE
jgi:nitrogen fixation-related uncharacterized protein